MTERIRIEDAGGIRTITIDRPQVRNALDLVTAEEMAAAFDGLDGDPDLRVGILTGAGGAFCAGIDLRAFAASGQRPIIPGRGLGGLVERPPRKPLIAAVEGYALGGGFEIALACDLIVASREARFGLPEVRRGLVAAGGGLLRLPRAIPPKVAMSLALTGDQLAADRAYEIGLVTLLAEPGEALTAATELATTVAANAPMAVRETKRIITESQDWPMAQAFTLQRPLSDAVVNSADAREGALAFKEKRPPLWTGA